MYGLFRPCDLFQCNGCSAGGRGDLHSVGERAHQWQAAPALRVRRRHFWRRGCIETGSLIPHFNHQSIGHLMANDAHQTSFALRRTMPNRVCRSLIYSRQEIGNLLPVQRRLGGKTLYESAHIRQVLRESFIIISLLRVFSNYAFLSVSYPQKCRNMPLPCYHRCLYCNTRPHIFESILHRQERIKTPQLQNALRLTAPLYQNPK